MISNRAKNLIDNTSPLMVANTRWMQNPWSEDNPNGALNFGLSQNLLMEEDLLSYLNSKTLQLDTSHLHYNYVFGMESLRNAFTNFAAEFLNIRNMNPDQIAIQTGASALCETLSFVLCDKDDEIMLPVPAYTGFYFDFEKRFEAKVVDVPLDRDNGFDLDIEAFEKAYNPKVKAVVLTNPNNPTARLYSKEKLRALIEFCTEKKIHLVSDEVYALSTINGEFESILNLAKGEERQYVHFIYSLAKDFALSGFKCGFFYSENKQVCRSMQETSYFFTLPNVAQKVITDLLNDHVFLKKFFENNHQRIQKAFNKIQSELGFKTAPFHGGIYLYADLSEYLEERSFEAENRLYERIWSECNTNINPGSICADFEPGWFRICFAKSDIQLNEFIKRFKKFLKK